MLSPSLNPMVPFILFYGYGKPCLKRPKVTPRKSRFGRREASRRAALRNEESALSRISFAKMDFSCMNRVLMIQRITIMLGYHSPSPSLNLQKGGETPLFSFFDFFWQSIVDRTRYTIRVIMNLQVSIFCCLNS